MQMIGIGALAKATGVKVPTIRYYEEIGLLHATTRTESNRRLYAPEATLKRLRFIKHARALGFGIEAIRELLALSDEPQRSCHEADAIASAHLEEIERKITHLMELRDEIRRMVCECSQERIEHCRVMEVLADHAQCLHHEH